MQPNDDWSSGDKARAVRDTVENARVLVMLALVIAAIGGFLMAGNNDGDNGTFTVLGWLVIVASVIGLGVVHAVFRALASALELLGEISDTQDRATP